MAEHRLQRLVRMFRIQVGNHDIIDLGLWWYRTQLYLHHAIRKDKMALEYAQSAIQSETARDGNIKK